MFRSDCVRDKKKNSANFDDSEESEQCFLDVTRKDNQHTQMG